MISKQLKGTFGLALCSHNLFIGTPLKKELARGKVALVIVATDANVKVKAELKYLADVNSIICLECMSVSELGELTNSAVINAIGVKNRNFAQKIQLLLKEGD